MAEDENKTGARKKTAAGRKKTAARKTAAAGAAGKGAAKKTAAKKTAAKKTPAKKTPAKKTAAKKAPAKKAAAKRAPAAASGAGAANETAAAAGERGTLRVTLVRSAHGRLRTHRACLMGLGLRRMHQTIEVADTPENRGMINKVSYMLSVEEA